MRWAPLPKRQKQLLLYSFAADHSFICSSVQTSFFLLLSGSLPTARTQFLSITMITQCVFLRVSYLPVRPKARPRSTGTGTTDNIPPCHCWRAMRPRRVLDVTSTRNSIHSQLSINSQRAIKSNQMALAVSLYLAQDGSNA